MGWDIPWYTITDDFDADFGVDEWHGTNAFYRDDDDRIFRTYFVDRRGDEALGSAWAYLDMTALGRQEEWEDSPEGYPQTPPYGWWNLHDEYDNATVFEAALSDGGRLAARLEAALVMAIAHVGGVPVEELVPTLAGAGTGVLVAARGWRCASDAWVDAGAGRPFPQTGCSTRKGRFDMSGETDEMKGRVKEAAGDLTDNKSLKNEGKTDRAAGKAKDAVDEGADKVKDLLHKD